MPPRYAYEDIAVAAPPPHLRRRFGHGRALTIMARSALGHTQGYCTPGDGRWPSFSQVVSWLSFGVDARSDAATGLIRRHRSDRPAGQKHQAPCS